MKKRTVGIAILLLLLIVGTVWAMRGRKDPKVAEMKAKLQEAFKQGPNPEKWQEFHQEMEKLTPDQRHQVHEGMRQNMERRMDERIDAFFALPPDKRNAFLDKQIQEEEKRRKEMEARRAKSGSNGGNGANAGAGQGGPRGPGNQTADARALRRNQMRDNTTPEQRAKRNAYRAAMQQRRVQTGLPASPQHGGR